MDAKRSGIKQEEVVIALSVGMCLLISFVIPNFQPVTAGITVVLVSQISGGNLSWKPGLKRLAATALGSAIAVLAVVLDNLLMMRWATVALVVLGMVLSMWLCRLFKMPPFSDRVSGITFILVAMVAAGPDRIPYALYRMCSTLGGVLIEMAVAGVFFLLARRTVKTKEETRDQEPV